ncbi:MAG: metallophosphoesterase [Micropruina sp.]|nr:metallophosphoesterase [Micropruina sp.]
MTEPQRILLAGDLHMNKRAALEVIDHAQAVNADLILQVGDFGFWPRARYGGGVEYVTILDDALESAGLELWFVPGNHEDWPEPSKLPIGHDGRRAAGARIVELPVGYHWTWGATRWLAVGGAPSVDKHLRTEGVDWFPEEEVSERQAAAVIDAGPAEVVVAHDAPMGTPFLSERLQQHVPPALRHNWWPLEAIVRADAHQERMRRILEGVRASRWFHGHHHVRYSSNMEAPHGTVRVEGLALDGTPLDELTLLVDSRGEPIPPT